MAIDTGKVSGRRALRFETVREALADAERVVAAEKAGTLKRLGNWSTGQVLGHLAYWTDRPYDGYPEGFGAPWFVRVILRLRKNKMLNGSLPAGVQIPKVPGGTLGTEEMSTEEGLARYRRAISRLEAGPPARDNIVFGPLTHEEWKKLNLRHAELHLSFLVA